MITIKSFLAVILMLSTASDCFFMPRTEIISSNRKLPTSSPRRILTGSSPTKLSADVTFAIEKLPSMSKNIVIVLAFGGGLIPAAIAANKSMLSLVLGKKNQKDMADSKRTIEGGSESRTTAGLKSLDPKFSEIRYIESTSPGPDLTTSPLLFQGPLKLLDIISIISRIEKTDDLADWKNLPSTKVSDLATPDNPPMWLPRSLFKTNIRSKKFKKWPETSSGIPLGGVELQKEYSSKMNSLPIPDNALDVVFDTWAWGASIATPDKVERELGKWRREGFDLKEFEASAVKGRSVTGLAIVSFIVIQVAAYGVLFVAPFLREFCNIDIGFGTLGSCGVDGCVDFHIR
ncbi:hypothetical protein TrST_g6586 [Triparma strigata]|uniref:Uncharacterized protein n=2 Tax=Triparma strigata TaxID=1606541 RepID=A0A9W6ZDL3_9STRA|nr:hypothetical protein TrST_g6586 [Triparma strigata]